MLASRATGQLSRRASIVASASLGVVISVRAQRVRGKSLARRRCQTVHIGVRLERDFDRRRIMMKVRIVLASLVGAVLMLSGCVAAPVIPPMGMLYSNFEAPLGGGPRESGSKTGRSSVTSYRSNFIVW